MAVQANDPAPFDPPIRVVASRRRRRSVSARMVGGVLELHVPAWMGSEEREAWAARMRERLRRQVERAPRTDAQLADRARRLNHQYFEGTLEWASIAWATQEARWGSCSTAARLIRISRRARSLPDWVLDYIVVHELAHLVEPGHDAAFWALVERYPLTERARGYLMAIDHRAAAGPSTP